MANKLMYNPNDDTKTYPVCRLQLVVDTLDTQHMNQPIKIQRVPKVVEPTNKKTSL